MKARDKRWSEQELDQFLANPQRVVPGSAMTFQGVKEPAERAAIVEYLKHLK
jgi:cytochrome c